MKPSLDSDEEEELGALQKTLRGDVFIDRTDDAAFQPSVALHKTVILKIILQKANYATSPVYLHFK